MIALVEVPGGFEKAGGRLREGEMTTRERPVCPPFQRFHASDLVTTIRFERAV